MRGGGTRNGPKRLGMKTSKGDKSSPEKRKEGERPLNLINPGKRRTCWTLGDIEKRYCSCGT